MAQDGTGSDGIGQDGTGWDEGSAGTRSALLREAAVGLSDPGGTGPLRPPQLPEEAPGDAALAWQPWVFVMCPQVSLEC